MKALFRKMVVMSAALVLLCVIIVAQNENRTENIINDYPRLRVSPNPVNLIQGAMDYVIITPDEGYYNPTIFYDGTLYEIDNFSGIEGEIFTIEPIRSNSSYSFIVRAKQGNLTKSSESVFINVEVEPVNSKGKNIARSSHVELVINVLPTGN